MVSSTTRFNQFGLYLQADRSLSSCAHAYRDAPGNTLEKLLAQCLRTNTLLRDGFDKFNELVGYPSSPLRSSSV